ncbi:MAG: hypothetical protein KAJ33_05335 [Thermoplasmata archaeon]|nr:hypothetical protein [Thermoplasmata archaeon]
MLFSQPALGDVAAEPAGGVALDGNHQTYLKNVYVFLNIENFDTGIDYFNLQNSAGTGIGYYTIYNPSNKAEELNICFDPGWDFNDVSVFADGSLVESYEGRVTTNYYYRHAQQTRTYYGTCFNLIISPHSEINLTVKWKFDPVGYRWNYHNDNITMQHIARYKIIGVAGWNHSIESVDVTFRIDSNHFDNMTTWSFWGMNETRYTSGSATYVQFHRSDFDIDELDVWVSGDREELDGSIFWAQYEEYNIRQENRKVGIILSVVILGWLSLFFYSEIRTPKVPTEPESPQ